MKNREVRELIGLRAVIYARVSTEEEAQLKALPKQVDECRETVAQNGWVLVDEYVDEGKSGTQTKSRGEYQRLMSDLEADKFDVIVVKDQSRLHRNTRDWYIFVDRLVQNGKKLYLYLEGKFFTPADDALITGIKAILAEEYSRELSKKLHNFNNRRLERARAGDTDITLQGSGNAYGWDKKDGKYTINPEQYRVKRMAVELVLQGKGSTEVAKILNSQGYRNSKGNPWKYTDIPGLVYDIKNSGTLILNRETKDFDSKKRYFTPPEEWVYLKDAILPIVTPEEWERLCQIKKERTTAKGGKRRGKKTPNTFTGKIICGMCGAPYWHKFSSTRKNKKMEYWTCSTRQMQGSYIRKRTSKLGKAGEINPQGCNNETITEDVIYEAIEVLSDRLVENTDQIKSTMVSWLNNLRAYIQRESASYTEADLEREKARKERLLDSLLDGVITKEEYKKKAEGIEAKVNLIEHDLKMSATQSEDIAWIDDILSNIDDELRAFVSDNRELRRDFLLENLERVVIYEKKILLIIPVIKAGVIVENLQFVSRPERRRQNHSYEDADKSLEADRGKR